MEGSLTGRWHEEDDNVSYVGEGSDEMVINNEWGLHSLPNK